MVAAHASADELPESIWLYVEDCPEHALRVPEVYAALRLELTQAGVRAVQEVRREDARAELTIQLRCDAGVRATLRLSPERERSSASRVVSLDDVTPKDRARALSLAVAELVRTEWSELSRPVAAAEQDAAAAKGPNKPSTNEAKPPSETKPKPPAASNTTENTVDQPESSSPKSSTPDRWRWRVDAFARWFTVSPNVAFGPAVSLIRDRFSVGVELGIGRGTDSRGVANYGFGAATVGFDGFVKQSRVVRLMVGPKLGLGAGWASGQVSTPNLHSDDVVQLYADARVEGALAFPTRILELGVRLAAGRAHGLRLVDRGTTIGATGGWFIGGGIGAAW